MRDFFCAFKSSCLFIGTVIGAGFATGEEIKLYFSGAGIGSVCLSALFFGLFSALFMFLGKTNNQLKSRIVIVCWKTIKIIALIISFLGMVTAVEELIFDCFCFGGGGFLTTALCYIIVRKNKSLSALNSVIVPIIVALLFAVFIKSGENGETFGKIAVFPAFLYASMNIFTAGMMVKKEGKEMSVKQILISALITTLIVGVLLVCVKITIKHSIASMPVLSVAKTVGLGAFASIVVYLAILTTLLSDVALLLPQFKTLFKSELITIFFFCVIIFCTKFMGFSKIVMVGYPIIGLIGVLSLAYALICFFREFFLDKSHDSVHSACKHT